MNLPYDISILSEIGSRDYMEDRHDVHHLPTGDTLITICDGHGGSACADFVIEHFPMTVRKLLIGTTRPLTALTKSLACVVKAWDYKCFQASYPRNEQFKNELFDNMDIKSYESNGLDSGTTLLACILRPSTRKVYLLSLGDSRAQWSVGNQVGASMDQKPDSAGVDQITNFPAWVETSDSIPRLNGDLALGSAIGDNSRTLTGCVGRKPNTYTIDYKHDTLKLILASDGLWDVDQAQSLFAQPSAKTFLTEKTEDNVTIVFISHEKK